MKLTPRVPQNLRFFFAGALPLASSARFSSSRLRSARCSSVSSSAGGPAVDVSAARDEDNGVPSLRATSGVASLVAFDLVREDWSGDKARVSTTGGEGSFCTGTGTLALALPPIIPSFPGRLTFASLCGGVEDVGGGLSLNLSSCGDFWGAWCSGELRGCAGATEYPSLLFLPPMIPSPPIFRLGFSCDTGAGGSGDFDTVGMRFRRGSGSGSESDAVASSSGSAGNGTGDGLFFLGFCPSGERLLLAGSDFSRGGVFCRLAKRVSQIKTYSSRRRNVATYLKLIIIATCR